MAEKNTSDILDQLAGAYLAIEELNRAIPQLQADAKTAIDATRSVQMQCETAKKILEEAASQSDKLKKETSSGLEQIAVSVKHVEDIQSKLEEHLLELPDISDLVDTIDELTERLDGMEEVYDKRLSIIESVISELQDSGFRFPEESFDSEDNDELEPENDEDDAEDEEEGEDSEYHTISELYLRNRKKLLLVVRAGWTNDFCFCVNSISDEYAQGATYVNGEVQCSSKRYRANDPEFKEYEGPSRRKINTQY